MKIKLLLPVFVLMSIAFTACQSKPEPIVYGSDSCAHCKMLITDVKYGAELITDKGKIYKFDSVECLADFYLNNKPDENSSKLFVADFRKPNSLIAVNKAVFLENEKFHSPMGMNVLALESREEANNMVNQYGGKILTWDEVLQNVKSNNLNSM